MTEPKQILLLVETSRVFGRDVIQGISRYAKERANWLFHFEDRGINEGLPPSLKHWQGDGIIARSPTRPLAKAIGRLNCPVVELLGDGEVQTAEVRTDEQRTADLAIDHLIKQGFERLAFYSFANSWWSDARRDAFCENMSSRGLTAHVFPGAYKGSQLPYPTWRQSYERPLIQWVERLPKPIGIWAVGDSQAIRVLEACRSLNVSVPAEVGILGTTNEHMICSLLSPSLSSIELNAVEVGYKAAAILDAKIRRQKTKTSRRKTKSESPTSPVFVSPSGVVMRESTNRLAMIDPEIDEAVKIIERDAVHGLTVDELAEELLLSRSTLERRFRQYFHCSPSQQIHHVRVERAKMLLRETAWPVKLISEKSGFDLPENFVRYFKRLVGETPRQFRMRFYGENATQ
ncbi:XylR family transcriptional regulator [Rhodopirellula sallentina]|uniref:Xylose operon regulatory protein n=1 Tax=Rhodopirellula sallentina SM41 TaxID=1263870 RepID=M5UPW1_9BACT|nr:DNA-binding transcriptional regulator [Rhodopirellula sallentina]EMI58038.1 xylose operon regulatory protein [Rhodopirellula sallentina SM41]